MFAFIQAKQLYTSQVTMHALFMCLFDSIEYCKMWQVVRLIKDSISIILRLICIHKNNDRKPWVIFILTIFNISKTEQYSAILYFPSGNDIGWSLKNIFATCIENSSVHRLSNVIKFHLQLLYVSLVFTFVGVI